MNGIEIDMVFCHSPWDGWQKQAEEKADQLRERAKTFSPTPIIFIQETRFTWSIRAKGTNSRRLKKLLDEETLHDMPF